MKTHLIASSFRLTLLLVALALTGCPRSSAAGSGAAPHLAAGAGQGGIAKGGEVEKRENPLEQSSELSATAPASSHVASTGQTKPPASTRLSVNAKSLAPAPSKLPGREVENWHREAEPGSITPDRVQQRIPTEALADWLVTAYRDEVDPAQVQAALQSGNWHIDNASFQVRDIDGDGKAEWLITLYMFDPEQYHWGAPGDFWVIGDEGLEYRFFTPDRYFDDDYETQPEFFSSAPQAIAIHDLTGDEQPELILERKYCGAHTCSYAYYILSNHFGTLTNAVRLAPEIDANHDERAVADTIAMTYADVQPLQDATGDGLPDFLIHGGGVGSAGSGIQRTRTEVWAWDGDAIALAETRLDPTNYRFHLLWEANDQFDSGNYDAAANLYRQVITDDSLDDEGFFHSEAEIYTDTRLFAGFRLVLLSLVEERPEDAQQWHDWMTTTYPNARLTEAATMLVENAQTTPLNEACITVVDYLKQFEVQEGEWVTNSPTGALRDMGYANPSLTAEDVCLL